MRGNNRVRQHRIAISDLCPHSLVTDRDPTGTETLRCGSVMNVKKLAWPNHLQLCVHWDGCCDIFHSHSMLSCSLYIWKYEDTMINFRSPPPTPYFLKHHLVYTRRTANSLSVSRSVCLSVYLSSFSADFWHRVRTSLYWRTADSYVDHRRLR